MTAAIARQIDRTVRAPNTLFGGDLRASDWHAAAQASVL